MSDFDWEFEATDVIDGGERVVAKFENYKAAVVELDGTVQPLTFQLGATLADLEKVKYCIS